jgi:AcrR family transcriptional regulator
VTEAVPSDLPSAGPAPVATRDRLLRSAHEVLADKGLEGLTLRAIARHAGVSHGAPLRHFPSLAALLAAVAVEGFDRLVETVDAAVDGAERAAAAAGHPATARCRLAAAGRAYVNWAAADPGVFAVTFRPERCDITDPEYIRAGAEAFGQIQSLVEAAQAEGWNAGVPPAQAAVVLWAGVHGMSDLLVHGALLWPPGVGTLDDVLDAYTHMIGTSEEQP